MQHGPDLYPKTNQYYGVLNTKLEGGTAGDLITCHLFDASYSFSRRITWPL